MKSSRSLPERENRESGHGEIEQTKEELAFVVSVVREQERENLKCNERERDGKNAHEGGGSSLTVTNDSQILAVNLISPRIPEKMLIRTSLPPPPSSSARQHLACAGARNDTLFSRKDTAAGRPRLRGNCVQSELRPPYVSLFPPLASFSISSLLLPLSAFHPRNLSRLCGGRARRNLYHGRERKKKKKKEEKKKKRRKSGCPRIRNTIVSPRSSGLHLRHSTSRRSDAMKRSHGSMQRKCSPHNTLIFALAVLMAFSRLAERKLKWKHGMIRESDSAKWKEKIARRTRKNRIKKREDKLGKLETLLETIYFNF